MSGDAFRRADQSVAKHFSRPMRACTSRLGVLTDPPLVGLVEAVLVIAAILAARGGAVSIPTSWLYAVVAAPVLVAVVVWLSLGGARRRVVSWLASVPFAVENVNGLLNGVGQNLLVRFAATPPPREQLNAVLEQVHPDCFALEYAEGEPEVEVRIGVLDSKLNPAAAAHRRFVRTRLLVDQGLIPLATDHPIESVRVC